jgi:CRISPR-associated protein Cas2
MTVILLDRVSASLRGDLSKWLLEMGTGVFVGTVSARVRDELFKKCSENAKQGSVWMTWKTNTEQGFDIKVHNPKNRIPVNWEGIWLVMQVKENQETLADEGQKIVS